MSINSQAHFSQAPQVNIERSRFRQPSTHLTTFDAGRLIPIYLSECLPGDSVTLNTASLVRMATPIFPVMDNCFLDIFYFYVPSRLLWEHWKEFNGENSQTYWTQPTEYNVPQIWAPENGWNVGSIADYMGIPTDVDGDFSVSALPFRAYVLCWNEFFRDQNYMAPAYFNKTDIGGNGKRAAAISDTWDGIQTALYGGSPLPVAKRHDMFTSVLPAPQKSEPMELPFFHDDYVPVGGMLIEHNFGSDGLHFSSSPNGSSFAIVSEDGYLGYASGSEGEYQYDTSYHIPNNLWADLTGINVGTINELRQAFQLQRLFERDALGGTRYTEILSAHFGVTSPDSRLQRPEFLGGTSIPINIDQVLQTSATIDGQTPQGNTAAFSLTTDVSDSFTKSFTEHGYILGFACVRTAHTYQQGLDKLWQRKRRFDFYWPALAHISEQPVMRSEIFLSPDADVNDQVFGYQEAWCTYRYRPSHVTGMFRSSFEQSLDSWHYGDYYGEANTDPFIADRDFMAETYVNVDRTLAVQSSTAHQFLADFYFDATWTRPMPMYSIPGLIDHF